MHGDVLPYLVPAQDAVRFSPWQRLDGEGWSELPDRMPDWDSDTDLSIWREAVIDLERVRGQCGLPADTALALTTSWTSSSTAMSRSAEPIPVTRSGPVTLACVMTGDRIAGVVTIRTTLTLAQPPTIRRPGTAWFPGSVLFEDRQTIALEATDPPFPMHEIDFSRTRLDPDASWHLETTTELTAPFLGTFLLLLNTRDKELIDAVARGRKDRRQEALVEELEHGVGALLLELALHLRTELDEREEWPAGTVGNVLTRILDGSARSTSLHPASGPHDLTEVRTMLYGTARAAGRGRRFL
jgi:hypothetical protein